MDRFDLAIIGGGVNGCGIARDAAGRGLKVYLCEMGDLAGATSSAASKLIHGGLRYLEYYEFRLVRESLRERERLLSIAPHVVKPMRFILPHQKGLRPAWMLRAGLFIYDHIGGRKTLPPTRRVSLHRGQLAGVLKPSFKIGFEYSDCFVDDSRLVLLNAQDAVFNGATVATRTRATAAVRNGAGWRLTVEDAESGESIEIEAGALVNAAGPWVSDVLSKIPQIESAAEVRLVRGSHIVVPRLYGHDRSYIFQNRDGRIIFLIPFQKKFHLIGTTDVETFGDPADNVVSEQEIEYLCSSATEYLSVGVKPSDVVHSFWGVRPLYDDGAGDAKSITRDYVMELDRQSEQAPLLNIYGGKLTTYRKLAEQALENLSECVDIPGQPWTASKPLPGGDQVMDSVEVDKLNRRYPWLEPGNLQRMVDQYGSRIHKVLNGALSIADFGIYFGNGLYQHEVEYLIREEWAHTAEDVLWRRTKLGLVMSEVDRNSLEGWIRRVRS